MKIIDKFNEVNAFGVHKDIEGILSYVYGHRIYISDVLDEEFPQSLLKATEVFLETDEEYDGDEYNAWKRFLNKDIDELLSLT